MKLGKFWTRWWPILAFVLLVILTFGGTRYFLGVADVAVNRSTLWLGDEFSKIHVTKSELPVTDTPPNIAVPPATPKQHTTPIYEKPFTPDRKVFQDSAIFRSEVKLVLFKGDFSRAELHIYGSVFGSGPHFLYLVYGNDTGILNGVRYSVNQLNVDQTKKNGGVFTKDSGIDTSFDLMSNAQFATTNSEFESSKQYTKPANLWKDNIPPPTVVRFLAAPLDASGNFSGAAISADIVYSCAQEEKCKAYVCKSGLVATQCIANDPDLGPKVAKSWCIKAGYGSICDSIKE